MRKIIAALQVSLLRLVRNRPLKSGKVVLGYSTRP